MKIAIVDDEAEFLEINRRKLRQLDIENLEIFSYLSVYDMENNNEDISLVLLDIDMPDVDGIEYAKKHQDFNIVFITSMGNRVKDAFGTNVHGFIEKSDSEEVFKKALLPIIEKIKNTNIVEFKINNKTKCFVRNHIIYAQYIKYQTIAFVYENTSYIVKGYTLLQFKNAIGNDFIYVNRETIVNSSCIMEMINNKLYLKGIGATFSVSLRRREKVNDFVNQRKRSDGKYGTIK